MQNRLSDGRFLIKGPSVPVGERSSTLEHPTSLRRSSATCRGTFCSRKYLFYASFHIQRLGASVLNAFSLVPGGKSNRGVRPGHYSKASGSVQRHVLQQLEALKILEKHPNG
jgi:hypothetical protein